MGGIAGVLKLELELGLGLGFRARIGIFDVALEGLAILWRGIGRVGGGQGKEKVQNENV